MTILVNEKVEAPQADPLEDTLSSITFPPMGESEAFNSVIKEHDDSLPHSSFFTAE